MRGLPPVTIAVRPGNESDGFEVLADDIVDASSPSAASAGQYGVATVNGADPVDAVLKSTACMPSMLINKTRLIAPLSKVLFCAIADIAKHAAARESTALAFFIPVSRTTITTVDKCRALLFTSNARRGKVEAASTSSGLCQKGCVLEVCDGAERSCVYLGAVRTSTVAGKEESPRLKPPQDRHADCGLCDLQVKSVW